MLQMQQNESPPNKKSPTMKHNKQHDNLRSDGPQLVTVRFEYTDPKATTVCLAGTFNHWQPEAKTLHSSGLGNWWKETALAPGTYEYCLVVDGKWIPDPLARETVAHPFGGRNSILKVASSPEAAHRFDAANVPLENANEPTTIIDA
jgi:1,4-alpha-glucan branching enzyme